MGLHTLAHLARPTVNDFPPQHNEKVSSVYVRAQSPRGLDFGGMCVERGGERWTKKMLNHTHQPPHTQENSKQGTLPSYPSRYEAAFFPRLKTKETNARFARAPRHWGAGEHTRLCGFCEGDTGGTPSKQKSTRRTARCQVSRAVVVRRRLTLWFPFYEDTSKMGLYDPRGMTRVCRPFDPWSTCFFAVFGMRVRVLQQFCVCLSCSFVRAYQVPGTIFLKHCGEAAAHFIRVGWLFHVASHNLCLSSNVVKLSHGVEGVPWGEEPRQAEEIQNSSEGQAPHRSGEVKVFEYVIPGTKNCVRRFDVAASFFSCCTAILLYDW